MADERESIAGAAAPEIPAAAGPHGCLTALAVLIAAAVVCMGGWLWLATLLSEFSVPLFGSLLAADLARPLIYGLALLILFGPAALLLRRAGYELWRGAALALAAAGGHALLGGLLLALDRELLWPGLPDALPPLALLGYTAALIASGRRRLIGRPVGIGPGLAAGFVLSSIWAAVGALGTPREIMQALLDALSTSLAAATLLALVFFYDPQAPGRRPIASALLSGAFFAALTPGLLAVRGWWLQGVYVSLALLPAGLIAGGLLAPAADSPEPRRTWWSVWAFLLAAFLLPLAFTSGLEGDWMEDQMLLAWGRALLPQIGIGLLLGAALLALRRPMGWLARRRAASAAPAAGSLALVLGIWQMLGQPGPQPDSFFVVMADQADTAFARDIAGQDARRAAVYATLVEHANASQADLRAFLEARGARYTPYYLVNGIEVEGGPLLRYAVARQPGVDRILESPQARPLPDDATGITLPDDGSYSPGTPAAGVDAIDAERVWKELGVTGEGIVIGSADSGVDWTHPALRQQYLGSDESHEYTWLDPWYGAPEPEDAGGHGTHTTGTILGSGGIGVAPGARWIACRNLARNLGNPGYYLDCMQFLFAPYPPDGDPLADGDPARGADLTNNSWGCPPEEGCDAMILTIAVQHLRDAGQMFIVSAGNEGPACSTIWAPANADAATTVGAVDPATGLVTDFSSRGPILADGSGRIKPDVVAPGNQIPSSVPGGGYASLPGTSIASPHVAGLVALLWSADPSLVGDIDATEQIIVDTARYVPAPDLCGAGTAEQNNVYGYGIVDAYAAVSAALNR